MKHDSFWQLREAVVEVSKLDPRAREARLREILPARLVPSALELLSVEPAEEDRFEPARLATLFDRLLASAPLETLDRDMVFGSYTLVRELGRGGMGVVFLARQDGAIEREVALKVVRTRAGAPELLQRFRMEQGVLGKLEHPNIARVIEAAETPDGLPYFVMEYVPGVPIDAYVRQQSLSVRQLLVLFLQVCRAIEHAHRRGIIHRDLKPTNVLVMHEGGAPIVKVIDFGIARALADVESRDGAMTADGQVLGSPQYMSPEQARGDMSRIDVRADVYSLGVLLHELLTGELPYQLQSDSPLEALRVVGSEAATVTTASWSGNQLEADLVTVLGAALRSDPDLRYESVRALADDLGAVLDRRPVRARRPTTRYLLRKAAQRHPVAAVALAVCLVTIVAAATALTFLYGRQLRATERAELEAERSHAVTEFIRQTILSARPGQGGPDLTVAEALDRGSEVALQELGDQPAVRAAVLSAVGVSLGELDRFDASESALEAARIAAEADDASAPKLAPRIRLLLAGLANRRGRAEETLEHALAGQNMKGADRDTRLSLLQLAATALRDLERFDAADSVSREMINFARRSFGPESREHATALHVYGEALHFRGRSSEAVDWLERAAELRQEVLGPDAPGLIASHNVLGMALGDAGRFDEALAHQSEALRRVRALLKGDNSSVGVFTHNLAGLLLNAGRYDEALPYAEETLAIWSRTLGPVHPYLVSALDCVACLAMHQGRFTESDEYSARALAMADSLGPAAHRFARRASMNRARRLHWSGRFETADTAALSITEEFENSDSVPWRERCYLEYGRSLLEAERGRYREAVRTIASCRERSAANAPLQPRWTCVLDHIEALCRAALTHGEPDLDQVLATRSDLVELPRSYGEQLVALRIGVPLLKAWGRPDLAEENLVLVRDGGFDLD